METKTENKEQKDQPKKCFCARCFLPIEPGEKVEVDGHNFHKMCSMCCVCGQVPSTIKLFYGHVFCPECFKNHVLNRFKGGEPPRIYSNNWWMQWAPGMKAQGEMPAQEEKEEEKDKEAEEKKEKEEPAAMKCEDDEPCKRCICARCLQPVDPKLKVEIGGQCFHPQCCRCYCCHQIPKDKVKIYYGQVFCEECFNQFVMAPKTPAEYYQNCFEQMQASPDGPFAEGMREFMASQKGNPTQSPMIFMMQGPHSPMMQGPHPPSMQGAHPPFCRCGNHPQAQAHEWFQANEPRKCEQTAVTPASRSIGDDSFGTWDLSFENRTEVSDLNEFETRSRESANQENLVVAAAEKIEKLTKYLQVNSEKFNSEKYMKKWKNFIEYDKFSMVSEKVPSSDFSWINLQDPKIEKARNCPQCLWQCGPIFVNSGYFQTDVLFM